MKADDDRWWKDTYLFETEAADHGDHRDQVGYSAEFETFYCEACDVWLSKKCSDPTCAFCTIRPLKPSHRLTGP